MQPRSKVALTSGSAEDPNITDEEADALARAVPNLFQAWKLSDSEACVLLGGMQARTWARWKEGKFKDIDCDLRMRMAHLIGNHKGVRYLFRDKERGYASIRKPNQAFGGQSALDMMLRGELSDLASMREWLNAERRAC